MLERIDYQAAALAAKTERLKLLKAQYELYLMRYFGPRSGVPIYTIPSPPPTTKMEYANVNLYPKTTYMPQNERQLPTVEQPTYVPSRRYDEINVMQATNDPTPNNENFEAQYKVVEPEINENSSYMIISPSLLMDNHIRGYSPERNIQPDVSTYSPIASPAIHSKLSVSPSPPIPTTTPNIPSLTLSVSSQSSMILTPLLTTTAHIATPLLETCLINNNITPVENKFNNDKAFSNLNKNKLEKFDEIPKPSIAEVIEEPISISDEGVNDISKIASDSKVNINESLVANTTNPSYNTTVSHVKRVIETTITNQIDDIAKPTVKQIHQVWEKVIDEKDDEMILDSKGYEGDIDDGEKKSFTENNLHNDESNRVKVIENMYKGISQIGPAVVNTTDEILQPGYEQELNQKIEKLYINETKHKHIDNDDAKSDEHDWEESEIESDATNKIDENEKVDETENDKIEEICNVVDNNESYLTNEGYDVINYQSHQADSNQNPSYNLSYDFNPEYQQSQEYDQYQQNLQEYQTNPEIYQQEYDNQQGQKNDTYQQEHPTISETDYQSQYQTDPAYQQNYPQTETYQQYQNTQEGFSQEYQDSAQVYPQDYQSDPNIYQQNYQTQNEYEYNQQQQYNETDQQSQNLTTNQYYNQQQHDASYQQDPNYQKTNETSYANDYYSEKPGENYYSEDQEENFSQLNTSEEHQATQNISNSYSSEDIQIQLQRKEKSHDELLNTTSENPDIENPIPENNNSENIETSSPQEINSPTPSAKKAIDSKPEIKKKRVNFLDSDISEQSALLTNVVQNDEKLAQAQSDSDFDFSSSK